MFYEISFDRPTIKIRNRDDYNERVNELFKWQIASGYVLKFEIIKSFGNIFRAKNIVEFFTTLIMCALSTIFLLFTLPFTIIATIISLIEFIWITVLHPIYRLPVIWVIPTIVSVLLASCYLTLCILGAGSLEKTL